jgi:hypothetical protein
MTDQQTNALADAKHALKPIAVEFMQALNKEPMICQNHYDKVLAFLSKFENDVVKQLFLLVMVEQGYDARTASQILKLM